MFGAFWVIRCKSDRKWLVDGKAMTALEWAESKKGFYSFKYVDGKGVKVNVKATAARASATMRTALPTKRDTGNRNFASTGSNAGSKPYFPTPRAGRKSGKGSGSESRINSLCSE